MQNTYFEIHIDETCSHNQVMLVPIVVGLPDSGDVTTIQLTSASYEKLMKLPKQPFNDNTLIKICTNI